nr:ribosomal protein S2 [Stephanopyxis turris]
MKLKKITQKKYNLLNYNLLRARVYLGSSKSSLHYLNFKYLKGFINNFCIFDLVQTNFHLKKSLKIIYEFHSLNLKILFIGFPNIFNTSDNFVKLFEQTNHYHIPQNNFINNKILNQHLQINNKKQLNNSKNSFNNKKLNKLNKILNPSILPSLIVLYDKNSEVLLLKNFTHLLNVPKITFVNSSDRLFNSGYKIPGSFLNKKTDILCYFLLKSILTRKNIIIKKNLPRL